MSECEEAERLRASCRVCLRNRGVLNIFLSHSALVKLRACAPIQISKGDGLPESICKQCANRLEGAYTFRERCIRSDRRLRWVVSSVGAESLTGEVPAHLRSLLRTIRARPDLQVNSYNVHLENVLFQVKEESGKSLKIKDNKLHLVDDWEKKEDISKGVQEGEEWKIKGVQTVDNKLHTVDGREKKEDISKGVHGAEGWKMNTLKEVQKREKWKIKSIKTEHNQQDTLVDREKTLNISKVQEGDRWKMKSIKTEHNNLHTVEDRKKNRNISKEGSEMVEERWSEDGEGMGRRKSEAYRCHICQERCEG